MQVAYVTVLPPSGHTGLPLSLLQFFMKPSRVPSFDRQTKKISGVIVGKKNYNNNNNNYNNGNNEINVK